MQPLDIRSVDKEEVLILWEDDHRSLYPASYLRLHCRCAHCVDEWTGQVLVNQNRIPANLNMKTFEPVGRYGVKFQWSDGHDTGIFAFEQLRRLCLCPQCSSSGKAPSA